MIHDISIHFHAAIFIFFHNLSFSPNLIVNFLYLFLCLLLFTLSQKCI